MILATLAFLFSLSLVLLPPPFFLVWRMENALVRQVQKYMCLRNKTRSFFRAPPPPSSWQQSVTSMLEKNSAIVRTLLSLVDFSVPSVLHPVKNIMTHEAPTSRSDLMNRSTKETQLVWFFADWCPHCNAVKEIWPNVSTQGKDAAEWHSIDCSSTNSIALEFNVSSLPFIVKIRNNVISPYNGKYESSELLRFARS